MFRGRDERTKMEVPCTNHNNCALNLTLLGAAIKKVEAEHRETERIFKDSERAVGTAKHDWKKHDILCGKRMKEAAELHLFYATRAHHRGRIHAPKRRETANVPGKNYAVDLIGQEFEIESTWARFKRVPKTDAAA